MVSGARGVHTTWRRDQRWACTTNRCGSPPSPLWTLCMCRGNRRLVFVSSNSENIFLITFLKPKTAENRQLVLWHIVNKLVPENVIKWYKVWIKHVAVGIICAWNIRNYRYVGDISHHNRRHIAQHGDWKEHTKFVETNIHKMTRLPIHPHPYSSTR